MLGVGTSSLLVDASVSVGELVVAKSSLDVTSLAGMEVVRTLLFVVISVVELSSSSG